MVLTKLKHWTITRSKMLERTALLLRHQVNGWFEETLDSYIDTIFHEFFFFVKGTSHKVWEHTRRIRSFTPLCKLQSSEHIRSR